MKKITTLALTAIASIMLSSFAAQAADQAKVTFKGNIYKATCSLSASESEVLMGSWAAKEIKKGDTDAATANATTAKPFNLVVGECGIGGLDQAEIDLMTSASLDVSGRTIPNGKDVIFNDNTDGKANAGVVMVYQGTTKTTLTNKAPLSVDVPIATAQNTVLPFIAYIGSVVDTPNPQVINSAVTFSIGYN